METLFNQLKRHEGLRLEAYTDTTGHKTIGYGHNVSAKGMPIGMSPEKITITQAGQLLRQDIQDAIREAKTIPEFYKLNEARQSVLINMCFNLGLEGLLAFEGMRGHLAEGDYEQAARHMEQSLWYKQVKGRAVELTSIMRSGEGLSWIERKIESIVKPEKEATVSAEKPSIGIIGAIKLIIAAMGGKDAWNKEGDKPLQYRQRFWGKAIAALAILLPVITGKQIDPELVTQTVNGFNLLLSHVTHVIQHINEDIIPLIVTIGTAWGLFVNQKGKKDAIKRGEIKQ